MATLTEHPTVRRFYEGGLESPPSASSTVLDSGELRRVCLDLGADDVGFVEIERPEIRDQEMDRWPKKMWTLSHKPVAVAAGLGRVGIHRNVIHPRFGNFVLLGTVVTEARVSEPSHPIDFNPCLECKLCVAACPTGAISPSGEFNFSACYTHNYSEFMGGFSDWVENVADSSNRFEYRRRVSDAETVSMWQSLGFGPNYKAAYCISVCPAGEEVIGPSAPRSNFGSEGLICGLATVGSNDARALEGAPPRGEHVPQLQPEAHFPPGESSL